MVQYEANGNSQMYLNQFLKENSLYSSSVEYDAIVADKARAAKVYLTSFIGIVLLYSLDQTKPALMPHLNFQLNEHTKSGWLVLLGLMNYVLSRI